MKDTIRPPQPLDRDENIIVPAGPGGRLTPAQRKAIYRWRLNVPASITRTRKERKFFRTEKEAQAEAEMILTAHRAAGDTLDQLKARKMSVTDALRFALRFAPKADPMALGEAIKRFIESRRVANCKPRYLANLKSQLAQVQEEFGAVMVHAITKAQVERFVGDLTGKDGETPASPKSRINFIITLTALFNFAMEEGWRGDNPAAAVRRPHLDEVTTAILTPAAARKLLAEGNKPENADVFPALVIQLFAGPRRSEIPHLTWELIRDRYLRLDRTKVRVKRSPEMPEVLSTWLAPYRKELGRIFDPVGVRFDFKDTRPIEDAYTYRLAEVATAAEISLPKNVLRHTAITYRVASTENLDATALWAGNSVKVIREHYLGAATKSDAEAFYGLRPSGGENVVAIDSG